jgi:N4-gp56 family major capsid protein
MYFTPLADVTSMPKHFGKQIKVYQYVPLLDDRNINDQGIDANGVTLTGSRFIISYPALVFSAANASKAAAATAINDVVAGTTSPGAVAGADDSAGSGLATITLAVQTGIYLNTTKRNAVTALNYGVSVKSDYGNLYGSSKDVGTIVGRLPSLGENGGRVNRVGFKRLERSASLQKMGFFTEFTQESFDFDSDEDLYNHTSRELVSGATQLTEAVLQIDLLNGAGTVLYAGAATSHLTVTGEGAGAALLDYDDLLRLSTILDNNRTPKQTKMIKGSAMTDTKVIDKGRVMYIGSELEAHFRKMADPFGDKAFISVAQYADAGTIMNGEIGTVAQFRIVVVPEMLSWAGAGAAVSSNPGYRATNGRYDVFPALVVGDDSFTTIGFQTDGKTVKFKITTKMPGEATADRTDPYGETGFSSIKWYYSTMIKRPERLAVAKMVAPQ